MKKILLLLILLSLYSQVFSQNIGPELTWADKTGNTVLLCNLEGKSFTLDVSLKAGMTNFKDGTYQLDYGNGQGKTNLSQEDFPIRIEYSSSGRFELIFSAETLTGDRDSTIYTINAVKRPSIKLAPASTDVQCLGSEIYYLVDVYNENTEGTKYTLDYDDGHKDVMTNEELRNNKGQFKHVYTQSYCHVDHKGSSRDCFQVHLIVENECGSSFNQSMTYEEKVAEPIDAGFTFDELELGYACSFKPVRLHNTTIGGNNIDCSGTDIKYEWDFGNGKSSIERNPSITYKEAKEEGYKIRLIAKNGYSCATDTAYEHIVVVDRVVALMEPVEKKICTGDIIPFINKSTGGGRLYYKWYVKRPSGVAEEAVKFVHGSSDTTRQPEIQFDHYGEYEVTLWVDNGCSDSITKAKIMVVENPAIDNFFNGMNPELDSLCPQVVGEDLRIDMEDYAYFDWRGNIPALQWSITPSEGVTYEPGFGPTSEFPRFSLKPGNTYRIQVELDAVIVDGVECGDSEKRKASQQLKVNDPVIKVQVVTDPLPDEHGVIQICLGEQVNFTNTSSGENLQHHWSITPVEGEKCQSNWQEKNKIENPTKANQAIVFDAYGTFRVTDTLRVHCHQEIKSFQVRVGKAPTINYFNLGQDSLVCTETILTHEEVQKKIVYAWYNNEQKVTWESSAGVEISDIHAVFPEIKFTSPGIYTIKAILSERNCSDANTRSEEEKTIRVRSSNLNCELSMEETEYCEDVPVVITNLATDNEGVDFLQFSWRIEKDGEPYASEEVEETPVLRLTSLKYGSYKVIGKVAGYCDVKEDTIDFIVHKNPEVMLEDRQLCPGRVVLASDSSYRWWNNTPQVTWEIQREDGLDQIDDYERETGVLTQLYPEINFKRPGTYRIKAVLPHAGCPEVNPEEEMMLQVYDPKIHGDIILKQALPEKPQYADVCENDIIEFENTMTEEANGLSWKWTVETDVVDGYQYLDDSQKAPIIQFLKYGEYKVIVTTTSTCNPPMIKEFFVTVRGVPEITFANQLKRLCAGDGTVVDLADYVTYHDRKNSIIRPEWTISPATGFEWESGYGADSDLPRLQFQNNAHYVIRLVAYSQCAPAGKQEFSGEIDVISADMQAAFSVGLDSVGCVDDPTPYEIRLQNESVGDSLEYQWTIFPQTGWEWIEGDHATESPKIRITQEGNYKIALQITNGCHTDDTVIEVKAFARPTVEIEDIVNVCETFHFSGKDRVKVNIHNDTLTHALWTITPNAGYDSKEYTLKNGTDLSSFFPDIDFQTCDYTVQVEYRNRCRTAGNAVFQVKVDQFIPIQPLDDDAICELEEAKELQGLPAGGYWTLKDVDSLPAEKILWEKDGKYYFDPAFSAYEEKDVELVYHFQNLSCIARDTMNIHIWPLPHVEAGDSLEMCLNHEPLALLGKDSVNNATWQLNRGNWFLDTVILENHVFKATSSGVFQLKYEYVDEHTCRNLDSTILVVHELPETGFSVEKQSCINETVLFIPHVSDHNKYEWEFGDRTVGNSTDTITHIYQDYGFHDVICRAENQYHCKDTSAPVRIEIVNLPPDPFFDVDILQGCAPFDVQIKIDTLRYADDHNYLHFHWDYGDGTTEEVLGGALRSRQYPSGMWDTTYVARFTVSNRCGTKSYDTTFSVYSLPQVSFAMMRQWECSPVLLELQNTTTGNDCAFQWTFTNGRTGEVVERTTKGNPVIEFTTDSASTTYYIHLRAVNRCNEDEFTDSLVVKPRSINAHFTPLDHAYACVNEEILFRNNSSDTVAAILNTYWNLGDGSRDTTWSPVHAYSDPGTYLVSLKIDNGCGWDTVSMPVEIYPLPRLTIVCDEQFCEADSAIFVLESDQELSHIEWRFGDGGVGHKDRLKHAYLEAGNFQIQAIGVAAERNQCTDSVQKSVTVFNKPRLTITPLDTVGCSPLLYVPKVEGEAYLMWDFGDGTGVTSSGEHEYENESDTVQRFTVRLMAETDKGCREEYKRFVTVYHVPHASMEKEIQQGNPQRVTLINTSEAYTNCIWELPGKGMIYANEDQTLELTQGHYTFSLITENQYLCRDTAVLGHEVLIKGLYFPNTFIPHSSNTKVNRFNGIGMGLSRYKLEVFDQYNNKIWETQALENGVPSEGWDGYNMKGKKMPQGVYIWRAEAIFADDEVWTGKNNESGVPQTMQGTVLLLRE